LKLSNSRSISQKQFGVVAVRHNKDLGSRKHYRVSYGKPGYVFCAPDAFGLQCIIRDISEGGIQLDVGELVLPRIFGVAFTANGSIQRLYKPVWRRGGLVGAKVLSAKEFRAMKGIAKPRNMASHHHEDRAHTGR
jgi:hypothetical protein